MERNIQEEAILKLHRNSRKPNRANHGARPNSSYMRRLKHKDYHKKITENKSDVIEPELLKLSKNPDLSSLIRREEMEDEAESQKQAETPSTATTPEPQSENKE